MTPSERAGCPYLHDWPDNKNWWFRWHSEEDHWDSRDVDAALAAKDAEIERLRRALRAVTYCCAYADGHSCTADEHTIARRALEGGGK